MTTVQLDPSTLTAAPLTPPPSKSDAHRALTLGALLGQAPRLGAAGPLPNDVRVLRDGLGALAGEGQVEVDCADGGAPFRILVTQAAVRHGQPTLLRGTPRLGARPHEPLLEALSRTLGPVGFEAHWEGDPWPLRIVAASAPAPEPRFEVDGTQSSQFATSLLLGAAGLHLMEGRSWELQLSGGSTSAGYLAITERWLERAGFRLERSPGRVAITGFRELPLPPVPGDWSSIGYLALIAWRTGGVVRAVDVASEHPDRALLGVLEQIGLSWRCGVEGLRVQGVPTAGLEASGEDCPDLLPTLAVLACVLPAPSRLHRVSILRHKESDRLAGIESLVAAAGGRSVLDDDTLTIHPTPRPPDRLLLDSHEDHRMAMAAATLAILIARPLTLTGAEHVSKSFPGFWDELRRSGAATESS